MAVFRLNNLPLQAVQFVLARSALLGHLVTLAQFRNVIDVELRAVVDVRGNEAVAVTQTADGTVNELLRLLKAFLYTAEHGRLALKGGLDLLLVESLPLRDFLRLAYYAVDDFLFQAVALLNIVFEAVAVNGQHLHGIAQVRLILSRYGNFNERTDTGNAFLAALGATHQHTRAIEKILALPVLQETAVAVIARFAVGKIAGFFIPGIYRIRAVHIKVALADGVEQIPVQRIQLFRQRRGLDVRLTQIDGRVPKETGRAIAEVVRCFHK